MPREKKKRKTERKRAGEKPGGRSNERITVRGWDVEWGREERQRVGGTIVQGMEAEKIAKGERKRELNG